MKKLLLIICAFCLIFSTCEDEESCIDTIIPEHELSLTITITVIDKDGESVNDYPVKYIIQKHFCDGDVGLPIEVDGSTSVDGMFYETKWWKLPYTNSKDYVSVYYYAGTGNNELGYSEILPYNSINNISSKEMRHDFILP